MGTGSRITGSTAVGGGVAAPPEELTATVRADERNLGDVARRLRVSEEDLRRANPQITNPNHLNAGQAVHLPDIHPGAISTTQESTAPAGQPLTEAQSRARVAEHGLEGQARAAQLRNLSDQAAAAQLIDNRTGGLGSLNEHALGADLAELARGDPAGSRAVIDTTMNHLDNTHRDGVALGFAKHLNDQQLRDMGSTAQGQRTLSRMEQEMLRGDVSNDERVQADRIHNQLSTATGLNPQARAEVLENRHTYDGELNEGALGRELSQMAVRDPADSRATIDATLNRLDSTDRDDVATAFTRNLNDQQLTQMAATPDGQQTLNRMEQEMLRGSVGDDQRAQADRIHSRLGSATGLNPDSRAEVLVNRHTHGLDLDERGLGTELSQMATRDPAASRATIDATMNRLDSTNRDDVATEFTRNLSNQQLTQMAGSRDGQRTLNRMEQEMLRGNVGGDERTQADRIHNVLGSATGLNPNSRAEVLIDRHTRGLNLDEEGLGRELSQMAARDPAGSRATIDATMNRLGRADRDDVAHGFTSSLNHQQLRDLQGSNDGRAMLDRMSNEMRSGITTGAEEQQINRIATARTAVNLESNPSFTALSEASRNDVRQSIERNQTNPAAVNNVVNLSTAPGFNRLSDTTRHDMLNALQNHPTDPQFLGQLRSLSNNAEFQGLNDAQRSSVISDTNRFARTSSYGGMAAAERASALNIIGDLSMNSAAAHPPRAAERNTLEQLVSGRVPMSVYNDPANAGVCGYSDRDGMHFNTGSPTLSNRHELVATAAHEVNHSLNGNTPAGTRERFLDEYRAWSMERQAADGENPASPEHMRGVMRNLATNEPDGSSYDHLRELYRNDPEFRRAIDGVNARLNETPPVVTTPEQMRVILQGLPGSADSDYLRTVGNDDNH